MDKKYVQFAPVGLCTVKYAVLCEKQKEVKFVSVSNYIMGQNRVEFLHDIVRCVF